MFIWISLPPENPPLWPPERDLERTGIYPG
jgi:hypothetical protein